MFMTESAEDYLEAILVLHNKNAHVRSIDIVEYLDFSKPSVSTAMKRLRQSGHIRMCENGYITLTDSGREIAEKIYERHRVIADVFTALGVDRKMALKDACKIEHDISEETFRCIQDHFLRHRKQADNPA